MSRPDAQAATKALVAEAVADAVPLKQVAQAAHPDLPDELFEAQAQMGMAPADARAFAARVARL